MFTAAPERGSIHTLMSAAFAKPSREPARNDSQAARFASVGSASRSSVFDEEMASSGAKKAL